jgi:serine/threonine-protein kinase PRP4
MNIVLGLPYDFALDMWSVGCTLYELYTGKVLFPGRSNNQMLHYMMELKGRFPLRMLKRGRFTSQHFDIADAGGDTAVQFCESYYDKLLGRESIRRRVVSPKAERDLRSRLLNDAERRRIKASSNPEEELAMVSAFVDLLEKVLTLNPERRLTVREALTHPFISGQYTV